MQITARKLLFHWTFVRFGLGTELASCGTAFGAFLSWWQNVKQEAHLEKWLPLVAGVWISWIDWDHRFQTWQQTLPHPINPLKWGWWSIFHKGHWSVTQSLITPLRVSDAGSSTHLFLVLTLNEICSLKVCITMHVLTVSCSMLTESIIFRHMILLVLLPCHNLICEHTNGFELAYPKNFHQPVLGKASMELQSPWLSFQSITDGKDTVSLPEQVLHHATSCAHWRLTQLSLTTLP